MNKVGHIVRGEPSLLLSSLEHQPADALLGIIARFNADTHSDKIDLGVGVMRSDCGATPVMRAVKAAEARLHVEQTSKSYLGPEGDARFTDLLAHVALGPVLADSERLTGVQTPGGTGALRLGAELLARANPEATVWVGLPTWPNHQPIFRQAGLAVQTHRFFDAARGTVDFEGMLTDLAAMRAGDVLLLHGCCHNPTGANLDTAHWAALTALCLEKGVIPFVDLAYQGLGDGLELDAAPTRTLLEMVPEALLAYSCDKNFGLYRDRVGALWVQGRTASAAELVRENLFQLARILWSMPPDHGAALVRIVLETTELHSDWLAELDAMRARVIALRAALGAAHPRLAPIADQRGMFALLPLKLGAPDALAKDHGIYMAGNGRINISGLRRDTVDRFASALLPHFASREGI